MGERYDYTYSEEELKEWVPRILELDAPDALVLIYANNHFRGQSIDAIRKIAEVAGGGSLAHRDLVWPAAVGIIASIPIKCDQCPDIPNGRQ